ncbi:DUF6318 family protein [Arthrobacter sp.]|uniref:DUF6318 family protein n=1 Tax=Arthrobacter sp. TaxID=1667 RepID=UPI003A8EC196
MKSTRTLGACVAIAAAALALAGCGAGEPAATPSASSDAATVPAPETNAQMKAEGAPGLSATTYYYFEAMTYAQQTGQTDDMLAVTDDCAQCTKTAQAIAKVYADGGKIEGGQPKPQDVAAVGEVNKQGELSAVVPFMQDAEKILDKDGKVVDETEWDNDGTTYTVSGRYAEGSWKITALKETPAAQVPEGE